MQFSDVQRSRGLGASPGGLRAFQALLHPRGGRWHPEASEGSFKGLGLGLRAPVGVSWCFYKIYYFSP